MDKNLKILAIVLGDDKNQKLFNSDRQLRREQTIWFFYFFFLVCWSTKYPISQCKIAYYTINSCIVQQQKRPCISSKLLCTKKRQKSRYKVKKNNNVILLPKLFWPTVKKKCSSDREKLLKFEAEGREFSKILRSIEKFVQTVKGQKIFW